MTNEQLAILIENMAGHLQLSIDEIHRHLVLLDGRAGRKTERRYVGPERIYNGSESIFESIQRQSSPENWKDIPVDDFVVLDCLRELVDQWTSQVDSLRGYNGDISED